MPRKQTKKAISVRLDRELLEEVRALTDNLTAAIEDGLRRWLRQKRRLRTLAATKAAG